MSPSPNSTAEFPSQIKTRRDRALRRRSKSRRGKSSTGRIYIFLIFLWLRSIDIAVLFGVYPNIPPSHQHELLWAVLINAFWTTALTIAIGFRQAWAKYLMGGTLMLVIIMCLALLPFLRDVESPEIGVKAIMGCVSGYLPVVLMLISSRNIRRLTSPKYESARWGGF